MSDRVLPEGQVIQRLLPRMEDHTICFRVRMITQRLGLYKMIPKCCNLPEGIPDVLNTIANGDGCPPVGGALAPCCGMLEFWFRSVAGSRAALAAAMSHGLRNRIGCLVGDAWSMGLFRGFCFVF